MAQKIQAVILSFNHPGITSASVSSALKLFTPENIYLVHNGSRRDCVDSLKTEFSKINHIILGTNLGFSGGANRGISEAFKNKASFVLFMSNDTKLKEFSFSPSLTTRCLLAPRIELRETGRVASLGGRVCFYRGRLSHIEESDSIASPFYVPGSAFIVGKDAWDRLGGFDESLGSYWEDVDLSLRAAKRGIELGVCADVILSHGVAKTTGGNAFYSVYSYHRNRRRVVLRHAKPLVKPIFAAYFAASILGKLFKFLKNKDFYRLKMCLKAAIS